MKKYHLSLKLILIAFAALSAAQLSAAVKMGLPFSDNMILQREKPVNIWGVSSPKADIAVEFNGQKKTTKAADNGKWSVALDPMKAVSRGTDMTVFENGKQAAKISNALVGEVWLLSGQSNMEYPVEGRWGPANPDAENVKARANYPALRELRGNKWRLTTPENVLKFSAVGFYFAEALMKDLDVPVGIVMTPMGGSAMIAWLPESSMGKVPYLKDTFEKWKKSMIGFDYKKAKAAFDARKAKSIADRKAGRPYEQIHWKESPTPSSSCATQYTPTILFKGRIVPLKSMSIRGVLWYQGESDADPESLTSYAEQMSEVVRVFRENFGEQKLPFYQVMLTSFNTPNDWAEARRCQMKSAHDASTGIVNILDVGAKNNIHPMNKQPVGLRLERAALRDVYGKTDIPENFVEFTYADFKNDMVVVKICGKNANRKITLKGELRGIEILTQKDGKPNWRNAPFAKIEDGKIVVHSDDNSKIRGVRYLWKNWANDDICLYAGEDIVFPFRFLADGEK